MGSPSLHLDPVTVREVLGDHPSPEALRPLEAEVAEALARLQDEIDSGQLGQTPILVRGRPLADYLPLAEVAWLLREGVARSRRRGTLHELHREEEDLR